MWSRHSSVIVAKTVQVLIPRGLVATAISVCFDTSCASRIPNKEVGVAVHYLLTVSAAPREARILYRRDLQVEGDLIL